jgi:preprotein translocase subunit SecA|uniref:Protein translocase subunit SecA n=2 Tax=Phaeodactylum tricornutum TaxID=2850 RepID=SECA_PHATC|nr:preprotein translocase subunit SecA [Phaeodactylum tricornutum]A0T0G5.1 RecName: Full=Protein translocase subunit SecA [Phaeodactylum tricornutum CCAP 1055/1]ABK20663.1 preprotein translocase subunit A [Phaeodactylum tricornutum]QHR85617.1 preprotein translocase subunit A [Phaeodactylum tricornutum]
MLKNPFNNNSLINKYQSLINQINTLEDELKTLTDSELRATSFKLKKQYAESKNLESLIPKSFALTREASLRTLGLRHFDVQLIGGLVLNDKKIAEMKTGEGKTLVATLPAYLNALTEKGVHIVTVNDYLANRDQVSMGQIYRFLGLNTGLIQDGMPNFDRRENYKADITYVTNYEVTFDFLRDNMALNLKDVVLRPFNYCIIDEVDSILIDEAQTPLIISNNIQTPIEKYIVAAEITDYLELNTHYKVDEKNKNVILTEDGSKQIEQILSVQDLYDPRDPWIPYIINALKANALYFNNVHYIVQNNRIIIVDEFTGRIMADRRWGDGLHQAIEAKEKLPIRQKTETVAAITYQNFFLLYPKLSGMTGTGKTAETEFEKIYNLSVEQIPTERPTQRKDLPDLIYKDQFSKWNAVAQNCNQIAKIGQPILVGTTTVEKSEMLAQLLSEYKLSYQILNAKPENVRRESEIVAQAGKKGSITIATNMAGRGTDIILGGNINFKIQKKLYDILTLVKNFKRSKKENIFSSSLLSQFEGSSQKFLSVLVSLSNDQKFLKLSDLDILKILRENDCISIPITSYQCSIRYLIDELITYNKKHQEQENQIVKNLGGLYIIGTERNDSRRVDNQLRGRCGRQGDPGTSRFFLSLDDNLLRLFGGSKIQNFMQTQIPDDSPLESEFITKSLDSAQERVEERAYQQRKNLFDYDDVLNKQRNIVYHERRNILESISVQKNIFAYGEQIITELLIELKEDKSCNIEATNLIENLFGRNLVLNYIKTSSLSISNLDLSELKIYLFNEFWLTYQSKITELSIYGEGIIENLERSIILINTDRIWREHLQKMTLLREAVGWRGYGQRNPLYEYKQDAFYMFETREELLRHLVIYDLLRSSIL